MIELLFSLQWIHLPLGVEFSGRSCAGINEINFKSMAESVSTDHEQLSFDSAFCQVETLDEKILQVISARYLFDGDAVHAFIALLLLRFILLCVCYLSGERISPLPVFIPTILATESHELKQPNSCLQHPYLWNQICAYPALRVKRPRSDEHRQRPSYAQATPPR